MRNIMSLVDMVEVMKIIKDAQNYPGPVKLSAPYSINLGRSYPIKSSYPFPVYPIDLGDPGIWGDVIGAIKKAGEVVVRVGKDVGKGVYAVTKGVLSSLPPINLNIPITRGAGGVSQSDIDSLLASYGYGSTTTTTQTGIQQPMDWTKILLIAGAGFLLIKMMRKD